MSGTTYAAIGSSTFLDFAAYELTSSANFDSIKAISGTSLSADQLAVVGAVIQSTFYGSIAAEVAVSAAQSSESITIALVLDRANDPSTLLSGNWAERQAALADQPGVAASYGADPAAYQGVLDAVTGTGALNGLTGTTYLTDGYYVSTAESRTIWLSLTAEEFAALFNTELLAVEASTENGTSKFYAWAGELSLPTEIAGSVAGLWVDQSKAPAYPEVANNDAVDPSTLGNGALGIGNGTTTVALDTPDAIARLYDFPLSEAYYHVANGTATEQELLIASLAAPTVAMLEASTLGTLESYLNDYRALLNLPGYSSAATGDFAAVDFTNLAGIGDSTSGETALDVSIIATASPNSSQVLYGYSGETTYTGYQWAIFDEENAASILSSSYSDHVRPTPDSPFAWAYQQLFVDAQLRNITVLMSSDDGGSSGQYGTGGRLVHSSHAVSSAIIVGGTSLSTYDVARSDTTLATIVAAANSNDVATLLQLVAGGLSIAPGHLSGDDVQLFVETVWNQYHLTLHEDGHYAMEPSYLTNDAGGGGVDKTQSMPSYQAAYGQALEGRGIPDVAALAGGNTYYEILNHNYDGTDANSLTEGDGGTSASAPLWAALTAQLDVIFADQGLPELGYYNDLLYIASAIAPGAFNDITQGDNTSSFFHYYNANGDVDYLIAARSQSGGHERILATDEGYSASSGYDLTTGLGTPNGLLLARALTAIAHTQVGGSAQPDVVSGLDDTTAASGANQTLLVQVTGALDTYQVTLGDHVVTGATDGEGLISSDAVVQKMLQSDFDPELVKLLDGGSHVSATTVDVDTGDAITATAGGVSLGLYQAGLTAGYGFAAFGGDELGVTVARPVTIAETPGGADNQDVVVRLRQSGVAESTLMIYQVEDLLGTIEGLRPGDANYGAAAEAMAYSLQGGGTVIEGPGFGNYAEVVLTGVNDGDILAMRFATTTNTYWAFAQANEARIDGEHATHVWSYGLNTWGWEDRTEAEGADQDFNDLIVQFDFTSVTGHDLLV